MIKFVFHERPWGALMETVAPVKDNPPEEKDCYPIDPLAPHAFLHPCEICGNPRAPFGYGFTMTSPGRWYCREHRPEGCGDP